MDHEPRVPAWFSAALGDEGQQRRITVEGTPVAYRAWGDPADRSILLVHGGAAHSRWWDHIAPLLTSGSASSGGDDPAGLAACGGGPEPARGWKVVAVDLSGHGDSGRRDRYSLDMWAREVLAVVAEAGDAASSVVIGHSMGGLVTLRLASLAGSRIAGAVAIDSPVRDMAPEDRAARQRRAFGPLRVYPTREAAVARFRPIPDQPTLAYIADHVAATSIRPAEGGWTWKFDPRVFVRDHLTPELLTRLDCRVALFRAERGLVTPQQGEVLYDRLGRVAPVIEIPAAGHHIMLDQPIALVAALRTLLSDWDHSIPHR
jgi:pimeloyl-ACP methyl ester carboxylesterase